MNGIVIGDNREKDALVHYNPDDIILEADIKQELITKLDRRWNELESEGLMIIWIQAEYFTIDIDGNEGVSIQVDEVPETKKLFYILGSNDVIKCRHGERN